MRHFILLVAAGLFLLTACESSDTDDPVVDTSDGLDVVVTSDVVPDANSVPDTVPGPDHMDFPDVLQEDVYIPDGMERLSDEEIGWYLEHLPGATFKQGYEVPEEMLNDHDYLSGANAEFDAIYDDEEYLLGFVRRVFSPVGCLLDECFPVEFLLLYNPSYEYLHVRSKGYGVENRDFMKYTIRGGHQPFTDQDRALLNTLTSNPPEAMTAVEVEDDLVELSYDRTGHPVSAATIEELQDYTVGGAVFTVWLVINYRLETDDVLLSEAP